jgi:hypothetical protein
MKEAAQAAEKILKNVERSGGSDNVYPLGMC